MTTSLLELLSAAKILIYLNNEWLYPLYYWLDNYLVTGVYWVSVCSDSSARLHCYSLWEQSTASLGKITHHLYSHLIIIILILQYTILLVIIFIFESVIGLLSYVYQEQIDEDLEDSLKDTFILHYTLDNDSTEAVDKIQSQVSFKQRFSVPSILNLTI